MSQRDRQSSEDMDPRMSPPGIGRERLDDRPAPLDDPPERRDWVWSEA
jgi:hypothetical protein